MDVIDLDVYKMGLKHGSAAEMYQPPLNGKQLEAYDAGYVKGFNDLMDRMYRYKDEYK